MHAYLTDTHREIKSVADRFAKEALLPRYMAREREETSLRSRARTREMGAMGLLAPSTPSSQNPGSDNGANIQPSKSPN
jgi:alkylation response protein AidB-like acyl-CoA dehydrogenase